jgi:hypothetical protein
MGLEWLFLLLMAGGGFSDALDLVPTDSYWQSRHVEVTEATIQKELAAPPAAGDISKLIDSLADDAPANREAAAQSIRAIGPGVIPQLQKAMQSDNPEIAARAKRLIQEIQTGGGAKQVRQLMAIRTAGEKKMRAVLPRLIELQQSKSMFVADYASAAAAAIEGKPYARPHADCSGDAWLLPAGIRMVLHIEPTSSSQGTTNEDLQKIAALLSEQNVRDGPQQIQKLAEQLIQILEKTGNLRIEGITLSLSGDVGNNSGHAVVLIHGQFDAGAVSATLGQAMNQPVAMIEGCPSIEVERNGVFLFPNNNYAAFVVGPHREGLPVTDVLTAIKTGNGALKGVAEMAQLIATVDTKSSLWGAMVVTDAMREAPILKSAESLTLVGSVKDRTTQLKMTMIGRDANGTAGAVGMVNGGLAQAKNELKREAERTKGKESQQLLQVVTDALESVKCETDPADPKRATLSGKINMPPIAVIVGMFGVRSVSVKPAEPVQPNALPPAPAPQPIPPPPQPPLPQAPPPPGPELLPVM